LLPIFGFPHKKELKKKEIKKYVAVRKDVEVPKKIAKN
jgi:hypothetical protein